MRWGWRSIAIAGAAVNAAPRHSSLHSARVAAWTRPGSLGWPGTPAWGGQAAVPVMVPKRIAMRRCGRLSAAHPFGLAKLAQLELG